MNWVSIDNTQLRVHHAILVYSSIHQEPASPSSKADKSSNEPVGSLYEKLTENLEIARDLTDTLKREKWRLSRRQMSVELRMGELEEYKSHLKRDMVS